MNRRQVHGLKASAMVFENLWSIYHWLFTKFSIHQSPFSEIIYITNHFLYSASPLVIGYFLFLIMWSVRCIPLFTFDGIVKKTLSVQNLSMLIGFPDMSLSYRYFHFSLMWSICCIPLLPFPSDPLPPSTASCSGQSLLRICP